MPRDDAPDGLRPYQEDARAAAHAELEARRSTLLVMPTGSGKTRTFAAVARDVCDRGGRVLVVAHRGELLEQARAQLAELGLAVAVEAAGQRASPSAFHEAVVASVPTLQGARLASWDPDYFDLVVVDEAHHATARTYRAILDRFASAKVLGVTATPERGDGGKLGKVFDSVAYEYPLRDAVEAGWLCRLRIERPTTSVDLSKIRTTAGDLNRGDLEDEIGRHVEELVNAVRARIGARPTLIFTPDVGSAEAFASGLRQVGVTARSVSGRSLDRHATLRAFGLGDFQALCNCVLVTEGVDVPRIAAIGMCRPTKSGVLYRQMAGRGLRPSPATGKEDCLIVDFAWNSGTHDLVSPVELFDTSGMDPAVQGLADGLIRTYPGVDPLKAIAQAERIHRHRAALAVTVRARACSYRFIAFDPLAVGTLLGVPRRRPAAPATAVTAAQRADLAAYRLDADGLDRRTAAALLRHLDRRRRDGLATHRQVAFLVAKGVDPAEAAALSFDDARVRLDALCGAPLDGPAPATGQMSPISPN